MCQAVGATAYCGNCGAVLITPTERQMEQGTFDWSAWEQSLAPFLGGLSREEEAQLLTMGPG